MNKRTFLLIALAISCACAFASGTADAKSKPLVMVWYPNESGEDMKGARDAFAALITEATGRPVDHKLTTDYTIAIEAIANGKADLGFFGPQGYVEAHAKNAKVLPLVVNSGASGTLFDAVYYSWLNVRQGEEGAYKNGSVYSIDAIQGKRFSWVSTSSTSGFKVPSSGIVSYFGKKGEWAGLKADGLLEGGKGKFFSEVLFGNSHQGSAVNLLTGKADVAAFCDTCVANYVELVTGPENRPGAVYQIRKDTADPFTGLIGKKFVVIQSVPVLNSPFIYNASLVSPEAVAKLREVFMRDSTTNNQMIFVPKGAAHKGMFKGGERFLTVEDGWFQPIRDLSK